MKIYLAGPEVFHPDALALGAAKEAICAKYGFTGLFPIDNETRHNPRTGFEISLANEILIEDCTLVIANLTPFRGPSADPGTVYELGYAAGLGKRIHGYSCNPEIYLTRVKRLYPKGDGMAVENFGLHDNLMMEGAIHRRGGIFLAQAGENLAVFEALVARLGSSQTPAG